jgi:hypothetical protein
MAGGPPESCARNVRCTTTRRNAREPDYRSFGWLLAGSRVSAGFCVSTGFCVSVGWPVTSPGRDDIPGSGFGLFESSVVLGLAGRATLPALP